jgi:hypothetical protein
MDAFLHRPAPEPGDALRARHRMTDPNPAPAAGRVCPFCGLATAVPHETQAGCIAALHAEISRMRGLLDHLTPAQAVQRPTPEPKNGT